MNGDRFAAIGDVVVVILVACAVIWYLYGGIA